MDKKIEDYLPFYLGCELFTGTGRVTLFAVTKEIIPVTLFKVAVINGNQTYSTDLGNWKPILRALSDMTEEEAKEMNIWGAWHDVNFMMPAWEDINWSFENFKDLLSKHFDLFGLIPAGLAIDATTLKK